MVPRVVQRVPKGGPKGGPRVVQRVGTQGGYPGWVAICTPAACPVAAHVHGTGRPHQLGYTVDRHSPAGYTADHGGYTLVHAQATLRLLPSSVNSRLRRYDVVYRQHANGDPRYRSIRAPGALVPTVYTAVTAGTYSAVPFAYGRSR